LTPPTTLGALLLVLALVPGWIYLRLVERLQPPSGTSGLHQLLEVLAVGVATTGVSAIAVVLVPHRLLPFTLDVAAWAKDDAYLRPHARAAVASVAVVFGLAVLLAYLLYRLRALRTPREFSSQQDVWVRSIGSRPKGQHPYIGLHLADGQLIEGPLHSYTFGAEAGKRDIALSGPIRITAAGQSTPHKHLNLDRLVVPESKISLITVHHAPAETR
jgi:flagellar biogenesis protein FliO